MSRVKRIEDINSQIKRLEDIEKGFDDFRKKMLVVDGKATDIKLINTSVLNYPQLKSISEKIDNHVYFDAKTVSFFMANIDHWSIYSTAIFINTLEGKKFMDNRQEKNLMTLSEMVENLSSKIKKMKEIDATAFY